MAFSLILLWKEYSKRDSFHVPISLRIGEELPHWYYKISQLSSPLVTLCYYLVCVDFCSLSVVLHFEWLTGQLCLKSTVKVFLPIAKVSMKWRVVMVETSSRESILGD